MPDNSSVSFLILTAHLGNADMIQPGLIPLQPNLDFMDTFEPFQGEPMGQRACVVTRISHFSGQSRPLPPFHRATVRVGGGYLEFFIFLGGGVVGARSGKVLWDIVLSRQLSFLVWLRTRVGHDDYGRFSLQAAEGAGNTAASSHFPAVRTGPELLPVSR